MERERELASESSSRVQEKVRGVCEILRERVGA